MMRRAMIAVAVLMIACGLFLFVQGQVQKGKPAPDGAFPCERVGNIDKQRFPEPSDIVYHPTRKTLFVVSDEGHVAEIKTDGTPVNKRMAKVWRDYEGITVNPTTGLLYVGVEGEEKILELDPATLETKREFTVERTFEGQTVMAAGGDGIEGLTFVADEKHAEGGTFVVAHQVMEPARTPNEVSALFEIELPLKTAKEGQALKGKIIRRINIPEAVDLSAVSWDTGRKAFYVLSDTLDFFYEVTLEGKVLHTYSFPGDNQEGVAVDPDGFVYVAQDSGGILKLKWLRKAEN